MDNRTVVDSTKTQQDAARVADAYMKFPLAGHYAFWGGQGEAQKVTDKFYPGYKVDAQPHQQVFTKDGQAVVNFNGTETPLDAHKTWADAASPAQAQAARAAGMAVEGAAASVGLGQVYETFRIGGNFVADKLSKGTQTLEERVEDGNKLVESLKGYDHVLLTGYSLGGLVARRVAEKHGLDALLFNSAVGRHTVEPNAGKRIVEFRIGGDAVSTRFDGVKQYTFDRKTEVPRGRFSAWEKLVADTDRVGQPTDPIQSHWLENFALSRKRLHDQLISERPTVATREVMHLQPLVAPAKDLFHIGSHCKPCPKGKLFCRC